MTTVSATSSGSISLPPRGPRSPLEDMIERRPALIGMLVRAARGEGLSEQAAQDVTQIALESAAKRERKGQGWDPAGKFTIERYLLSMLHHGIDNWRRSMRRNPAVPVGDAADVVSAAPDAEQTLASEEEQSSRLDWLEEAIRAFFADETDGHIPIGIMDQRILGVRAHDEIAAALRCSPEDVKRGYDRLVHHAKRIAGMGKKGKPS